MPGRGQRDAVAEAPATAYGDTQAEPTSTDRLIYLANRDQGSLADSQGAALAGPLPQASPAARRAWPVRPLAGVATWRTATGAAGTALVVLGCAAFLLGSAQPGSPAPRVTPAVDAYWPQHGYDTDQVPVTSLGSPISVTPADPALPGSGFPRFQAYADRLAVPSSYDPLTSPVAVPATVGPAFSKPPGAPAAHRSR